MTTRLFLIANPPDLRHFDQAIGIVDVGTRPPEVLDRVTLANRAQDGSNGWTSCPQIQPLPERLWRLVP